MELSVSLQGAQAAAFFLLGAALGLFYDLVWAFRRRARSFGALCADLIFCAGAALALFVFALGPGAGQLRIFMLAALGLGAAVYAAFLSPSARPPLAAIASFILRTLGILAVPAVWLARQIKKVGKIQKNFFQKLISWFTIITTYEHKARGNSMSLCRRGDILEAQKGKYTYEAPNRGAGAVRGHKHRHNKRPRDPG